MTFIFTHILVQVENIAFSQNSANSYNNLSVEFHAPILIHMGPLVLCTGERRVRPCSVEASTLGPPLLHALSKLTLGLTFLASQLLKEDVRSVEYA